MEKSLLSQNTVERMIGAPDVHEAFRALSESDYSSMLDEFKTPNQTEKMVMRHLRDVRLDLQNMIGSDSGPLQIIWRKYDFHNLKSLIKIQAKDGTVTDLKKLLVPLGSRSRKIWLDFFETGSSRHLRPGWLKLHKKALATFAQTKDPRDIDFLIDQEYFLALQKMTASYSPFFQGFIKRLIDIFNITLRLRLQNDDNKFSANFAPGGFLPRNIFRKATGLENRIIGFGQGYDTLKSGILLALEKSGSFSILEKQSDDLITTFLHRSKTISFGPEPVFSYWLAKKNNAMIIRTIINSKLAGIPQDRIRHHLRQVF